MSSNNTSSNVYSALIGAAIGAVAGIATYKAVTALARPQKRAIIVTDGSAPKAIGPYSHACKAGELVFVSGSIGMVPATGEFKGADVASQTEQIMSNLAASLKAAGCTLDDVCKTTILLADMADFATVNGIYEQHFGKNGSGYPARATFAVKGLPKGALVEIEAVALAKQ